MPSFADSIFLFVLALLLFGPKKLPVLARELGKWMGEFRRASNEFKMQMDEELRTMEQADRQKQIAAMEAAAPIPPPLPDPADPEPPNRHTNTPHLTDHPDTPDIPGASSEPAVPAQVGVTENPTTDGARPIPIAVSGSLQMMPPTTGLPTPRNARPNAVTALADSLPEASCPPGAPSSPSTSANVGIETESVAHAD